MFEVYFRRLRYIRDVPVELTDAAVAAGELRRGAVVGADVSAAGEAVFLELRLSDDGQARLLKPGTLLLLEGSGGVYSFAASWSDYLGACRQGAGPDPQPLEGESQRPRAMGI